MSNFLAVSDHLPTTYVFDSPLTVIVPNQTSTKGWTFCLSILRAQEKSVQLELILLAPLATITCLSALQTLSSSLIRSRLVFSCLA